MINNNPNKYQQSSTSRNNFNNKKPNNPLTAQKEQEAEKTFDMMGCLVHLCGFLGLCFVLTFLIINTGSAKVPVILIPLIKLILLISLGNETFCIVVGIFLLAIYGICYLLFKDKYFKKDD